MGLIIYKLNKFKMNRILVLSLSITLALNSCQSKEDRLNRAITNAIEKSDFNGYLYVERDGDVLFDKTITSPSLELGKLSDTTKTYLASLTKLLTEVAILKLEQRGEIDLDSSISAFRSNFEPDFGYRISVDNLLKMSSGLPRELSQDTLPYVLFNDRKLAGPFLDSIPDFELSFEPGSTTEYSNLNYWILGAIIEQITDKSLHDAFKELMFDELGMRNTGIFNNLSPIQRGYMFTDNEWNLDTTNYQGRYASGGGYSTGKDLVRLSKALSEGNFLSSKNTEYLASTNHKIEVFGSLPGYSNMFIKDIESDYTIILLNNTGVRDLSDVAELKTNIENELGVSQTKNTRRVVKLDPIHTLNDSLVLEKSLKTWINTVENQNADEIFKAIENASTKGSMDKNDRTWDDLSKLNKTLPNFRALGYRWVKDQNPKGIEVWFGSDSDGKLAIRWILNEQDSTLVENIFIMPEDMTWQGESF